MAVSFDNDTWKFVEQECKKQLENHISTCTQPKSTFEETLMARGSILALKQILNLPQHIEMLAANKRH